MKKHLLHRKILYPTRFYQELPPFASNHNHNYDYNYYRCFCIDYNMFETDTFCRRNGWFPRFKPFLIPKIRNNILKYLFGTRKYYIRTEHDQDWVTFSEDLTKKEAKARVAFENNDDAVRDIYYSHIDYDSFLFSSRKEKKSISSIIKAFIHIHSHQELN